MLIRRPAPSASIIQAEDASDKPHAPSAARNANDLCAAIQSIAPIRGGALEIASGTGQHIIVFAAAMLGLHWHPSEVGPTRRASIIAYTDESGLTNIAAPATLNATQSGWSLKRAPKDLITVANLLHLISKPEAKTLITDAAKTHTPHGRLLLYGPLKRSGRLTSDGDITFDAQLRTHDPETGYKDDTWVTHTAKTAGLIPPEPHHHARQQPRADLPKIITPLPFLLA